MSPTPATVSIKGTISRTAIRAGDTTTVTVTATNGTSHVMEFNGGCIEWYSVQKEGVDLIPDAYACGDAAVLQIIQLAPQESYIFRSVYTAKLGASLLAPGNYQIQPRLRFSRPYPPAPYAVGNVLPLQVLP